MKNIEIKDNEKIESWVVETLAYGRSLLCFFRRIILVLYLPRVLQLKAELLASSKELPRAIDCLLQCMDLCRKYNMKSVEAEISICLAQCKVGHQIHRSYFIYRHLQGAMHG